LAHRRSIDLDLFRDSDFDPDQLLRELLSEGVRFQYPNRCLRRVLRRSIPTYSTGSKPSPTSRDAEREPELAMLVPLDWREVRALWTANRA
jgi:hypothetical protein